jgi:uncharacterized protein YfbU (UPF0304 family)
MEQRENWPCPVHEESFRVIHKKLDDIIERQIDYAKTSARIEMKQEQIEKIVTNGLSYNMADLSNKFDVFREEVKERLKILESFQWFRVPITKLKDKIFWFALKVALLGGMGFLILYYIRGVVK